MADKRDPNTQNSARPSLWSRPPGSHRIVLNQSVQRARFGLWESPLRALCSLFAKNRILTVLGAVLVHRLRGGRGQRNWETWLLQTQWTVWEGPGNGWDLTGTGISSLWPPWITRTLVSNYNKRCARHRLAPSLRHLGWMQGASGVRGLVTLPRGLCGFGTQKVGFTTKVKSRFTHEVTQDLFGYRGAGWSPLSTFRPVALLLVGAPAALVSCRR